MLIRIFEGGGLCGVFLAMCCVFFSPGLGMDQDGVGFRIYGVVGFGFWMVRLPVQ